MGQAASAALKVKLGGMKDVPPSFTDVEYGMRRRSTRREAFLTMMDEVIPWAEWIGVSGAANRGQ